jgi:hypothetical protein
VIERFQGRDLDERERNVLEQVECYGWSVTNIREQDGKPGWAFTVGLFENFSHPEITIFGLKPESRHSILNWIGQNVRDGVSFGGDKEHDWVLDGFGCWSRDVQKLWYRDLFGWAIWFYGGTNFPVVQCLWPAEDGSYPWQAQSAFVGRQPLLYEADLLSARMMHYVDDDQLVRCAWPFGSDPHQRVFVSRCVVEDNAPIVRVVHDADDDWQFIGPVDGPDADGCKVSCFHCVVERDQSIRLLAGLSSGWQARRRSPSEKWTIEPETVAT